MDSLFSDADKKKCYRLYMKDYMSKRYRTNAITFRRKKNCDKTKKDYELPDDLCRKYGDHVYNVVKINVLLQDMPEELVNTFLAEDRNIPLKKKVKLDES